jgi:uncharacterized protein (DUF433 family)
MNDSSKAKSTKNPDVCPISCGELPDCLVQRDDGAIVVRGHRISLFVLLDRIRAGATARKLRDEFPTLPADAIKCIIAFCKSHPRECDEYFAWWEARIATMDDLGPSLSELKRRRTIAGRRD